MKKSKTKEQKIAIRQAAMKKIKYADKKKNISDAFSNNKEFISDLKKDSRCINKSNMAKVIMKVELYHKVYKDLELIVSGINRTNGKLRIKKMIKDVIDKQLSDHAESLISRINEIKESLEKLGEMADIDIYKAKDKIVVAAKNRIYNDIMEKAEMIYDRTFFPAGNSRIKKAMSKGGIGSWLRNKNSARRLKSFTDKLTSASYVINETFKVVKRTKKVIKVLDSYAEGKDLLNQSNNLTSPKHYKEYYYKVAQKASKMASVFKSLSGKLPPGMREYYEFIFTVAENTDKMAKVVYDYTGRLENAMAEIDKETEKGAWDKLGEHHSLIGQGQGVHKDHAQIRNQN